ncbi:dienelactone hydrolase [Candidatus Methylacidiphilum fumarolicum]|uniref:Dienelactone hydrolase or related enzyme (Modular protein) n=3 Tax=Candidatus Methylacidiphilum fumarolicum TaxID=591154 RepID=I0K029_METFB|nr:dienelactone hydrolase family protein [Candidatus Methylacidiphilum fumarolicum]TFE65992.1 dienelactone hydrolase [Candidatus Methylacidiphilum fumarolicum]TFE77592.1 dienelactone hydrolase [Candidatus Methylacidiphilum fumarolicum]CAI9085045.1 Dienelactone hydrolase or related enzyme (Modular protein) [Candidatus Methylacidiphilum fumarolicum]CCG92848.1 Dienelactone hydrolase or related enzyme (modular protein) [Methylacidiphilum fumariolicum SolV]
MLHFSFAPLSYMARLNILKTSKMIHALFCFLLFSLLAMPQGVSQEALNNEAKTQSANNYVRNSGGGEASVSQPAEPVLRGAMVKLTDFGSDDVGYLSIPDQEPKGGVVLVPGIWGLSQGIKFLADHFSKDGYVALVVDLFNGIVPKDSSSAADLRRFVREESALNVIAAAVRFLHESPRFHTTKVGVVGWDIGGEYTLEAAINVKGINAVVIYYGEVNLEKRKLSKLRVPVCYFYAEKDQTVSKEKIIHFVNAMEEEKKPLSFYSFEAQHGFADPASANYDPTTAEAAWNISINFLEKEFNAIKKETGFLDRIIHSKD